MLKIAINLLIIIHVLVSLLIVLVVLMQRPKSEGLGAAFGGGLTDNLFGAQTTNALQSITRWLGGIFFAITVTLAVLYSKQSMEGSALGRKLMNDPVPAVEAAPAVSETPVPAVSPVPAAGSEATGPAVSPVPSETVPESAAAEAGATEESATATPSSSATPAPAAP